ncbi:hypothetical protein PR202_ga20027 [Eleusine coracana subsp. coracana]|uniref:Co-chaperone protein p23 n=1 Tax=Eleusine coracana subsp. coracana TaxID=191504 RepID=A0AAV5CVK3_ELECO|nr:hypothetical protein PR202_ga20027 [Eleusine coracana subsp. coracana]
MIYAGWLCSPHPSTRWTQRSGFIFIVIEAPAAKDIKFILSPDGHFKFCAMGDDDLPYELDLELFDAINLEESKLTIGSRHITYLIKMADPKWWKRLLKEEGKPPAFLKIDSVSL